MDHNILLNIARFAPAATALKVLKAGGKPLFDAAKHLNIIQEATPADDYFEITYMCSKDRIHQAGFIGLWFDAERVTCNGSVCKLSHDEVTGAFYCKECLKAFEEHKLEMLSDPNKNKKPFYCHVKKDFVSGFEMIEVTLISNNKKTFEDGLKNIRQCKVTLLNVYQRIKTKSPSEATKFYTYNNKLIDVVTAAPDHTICLVPIELPTRGSSACMSPLRYSPNFFG